MRGCDYNGRVVIGAQQGTLHNICITQDTWGGTHLCCVCVVQPYCAKIFSHNGIYKWDN
jgi:hypothetical protein